MSANRRESGGKDCPSRNQKARVVTTQRQGRGKGVKRVVGENQGGNQGRISATLAAIGEGDKGRQGEKVVRRGKAEMIQIKRHTEDPRDKVTTRQELT